MDRGAIPERGEGWRRIEALFLEASSLPPEEREPLLEAGCRGEPDLRREVDALLAAADGADDRIAGIVQGTARELLATRERPAQHRFGPYRVLREIGRGGMGTVYLALRDDREYEARVAIKLVRRGMDGVDARERLRQERQILARLEHPGIARLLDGGTTDDGLPYFVMEYVEGEPIDRYCRRRRPPLAERLRLFLEVCSAVHYAHRNLVLHRDLKPGNLLVTGDGAVKLLDFGISKLLAPGFDPGGTATAAGVVLATPEYASPEQLRGEALSTASDVYALGVLLYRLLSGGHPQRPAGRSPAELARAICEEEPEAPGEVVRRDAGRHLPYRRLPRDLDRIVLKALRKEPERRYGSAEQLAEDLRRYLQGLPVTAGKGTFSYRLTRLIARHRVALVAAALVLLALVAGTVATARQARIARRAQLRAESLLLEARKHQARAERIRDFLIAAFEEADPRQARGREITAREVLERGSVRVFADLAGEPAEEARMLAVFGDVYRSLGDWQAAERLLRRALELRRGLHPAPHPDLAASLNHLGELLAERNRLEEAEGYVRQALEMRRRVFGPGHGSVAESLNNLAVLRRRLGDPAAAERLYRRALTVARVAHGDRHPHVAAALSNLGHLRLEAGRYSLAKSLFEQALALQRSLLGPDHPDVARTLSNLGSALVGQGELAAAEAALEEALEIRTRTLGDDHPEVARSLANLAAVVDERGDLRRAEALYHRSLAHKRRVYGDRHPTVLATLDNLAWLHFRGGRWQQAEALYRELVAARRASPAAGDPDLGRALARLGACRLRLGDRPGARELLLEARSLLEARHGPGDAEARWAAEQLAEARAHP